ncbi:MAG: 50S ribosomal protein L32 [bacterium]
MAVPFRRTSSTRRDKRRTHDKLTTPALVLCKECGELKLAHRVCKHCGSYDGVKVK